MDGLRFKNECAQPLGICVKSNLGRMVLPSSNCSCAAGIPQGPVTLPPLLWIIMGLGVLLYTWLASFAEFINAWQIGFLGSFIMDLSNLFLPLNIFGLVLLWGAGYEFRRRKRELEAKRSQLSCEK